MKMPAFQFYPADWRKDPGVQALNRHDRSVWFDMLCIMHESDERGVLLLNGLPMPEPALAQMLNLDNQTFNLTINTILTYGVASRRQSDGAIYSRRMVRDEKLCQLRREQGKKGGNPILVNQRVNPIDKQNLESEVNQNPTPSSSSSITYIISSNGDAIPENEFEKFWENYDKKVGKKKCEVVWARLPQSIKNKIAEKLPGYIQKTADKKFRKDPLTWLNGAHWDDEIETTGNSQIVMVV